MKRLFVACVLALAATLASQQRASAWGEFNFAAGFKLHWTWTGYTICCSIHSNPPPPCCYPACCPEVPVMPCVNGACYGGYPAYAGAAPAYYGGYAAAQAPAFTPLPAAAPAPQAYNAYNSGYQPVGYSYAGYGPSVLPSYWYGR
jgi:hypothetical protein